MCGALLINLFIPCFMPQYATHNIGEGVDRITHTHTDTQPHTARHTKIQTAKRLLLWDAKRGVGSIGGQVAPRCVTMATRAVITCCCSDSLTAPCLSALCHPLKCERCSGFFRAVLIRNVSATCYITARLV